MTDNNEERREYFRVNDSVTLNYRIIDEEEFSSAPEPLSQASKSDFMLGASLAALDYEFSNVFNQLQKDAPDVARYFSLINRKIDILRKSILRNTEHTETEAVQVDLSAAGIAFPCNESIKPGTKLEIQLVLQPEFMGILVYGVVRQCSEENSTYMIGVDFQHLRESDREYLIRHNLNIQMLQLRQRNEME